MAPTGPRLVGTIQQAVMTNPPTAAWRGWNKLTPTTAGVYTTTNVPVWQMWNGMYVANVANTANTTLDLTWPAWNNNATTAATSQQWYVVDPAWVNYNTDYVESAERRAARKAAEAEYLRQRDIDERLAAYAALEREAEAKEAQERAEAILQEHLSGEQKVEYADKKRFRVLTRDGREFLLTKGVSWNAFELKDGKKVRNLCIHPHTAVPDADILLAQKLMLEAQPDEFARIANKRDLHDQVAVA